MGEDTNHLRIWATHLRWAALCPSAWEIVFSGRIPLNYSTPPIVEETRGIHDEIVKKVEEWFIKEPSAQYISRDSVEYTFKLDDGMRYITIVFNPDLYVLWNIESGKNRSKTLVNLVVEVTTRSLAFESLERLVAEMLGFYIRNLRPTFTVLVQLEQPGKLRVRVLPLSTNLFKKLEKLILYGTKRMPTPSLCYNCDLRSVCYSPLT